MTRADVRGAGAGGKRPVGPLRVGHGMNAKAPAFRIFQEVFFWYGPQTG